MKKVLLVLLVSFGSLLQMHAQEKKNWVEMHQFHAVMGKSFHPAEEGNLQPLKDNAAQLLEKAEAWQKSVVPQGYNKAVTAPILKDLVAQCKVVKKAVADKKTDEELTKQIIKAHDIFHEIMEKCQKGEEDHKH